VRRFSLSVRERLLEENRLRRDTGVATELEVLQAEVGVANATRDLLLAEQTEADRADALLRLMGREEFAASPGPLTLPPTDARPVDLSEVLGRARLASPEFWAVEASRRIAEQDLVVASNNYQPQLDLGGTVGLGRTAASGWSAAGNLGNRAGENWQVDLTLRLPWGLREEAARERQARYGLTQNELFRAQLEQTIVAQVRAAVRALETNRRSVAISATATALSAKQFEIEKARYDNGLSTFRRVQESQDDLDLARLAELQAQVNERIARANLDRLEAASLERYGLTLPE
jgi:outer membrane protein